MKSHLKKLEFRYPQTYNNDNQDAIARTGTGSRKMKVRMEEEPTGGIIIKSPYTN